MTDEPRPPKAQSSGPRHRPRWLIALGWLALAALTLLLSYHRHWSSLAAAWIHLGAPPPLAWQQVLPLGTEVKGLALTENGDTYLTGEFTDTLRLGGFTLVSAGETDVFVARFQAATGTFSWVQRAGGPGYDVVNSLVVNNKRLYIAGYSGAIEPRRATVADFGPGTLPSRGISDLFVARLDESPAGAHFSWVQSLPGAYSSDAQKLAVLGDTIYLTGTCTASPAYLSTHFSGLPATRPDTAREHTALFLAKLNDSGRAAAYAATLVLGLDADSYCTALVAGRAHEVFVAGNFAVPPFLHYPLHGDIHHPQLPRTAARIQQVIDNGPRLTLGWQHRLGDSTEATVEALTLRGQRLYAAGGFRQRTHLGATELATPWQAGYLACLTTGANAAQVVWALPLTGPPDRASLYKATTLALRDSAVYVAGWYKALPDDGGDYLSRHPSLDAQFQQLADYSLASLFVAQVLDAGPAGQLRWQQATSGLGLVHPTALAAGPAGVYVAGYLSPPAQFGRFWFNQGSAAGSYNATGFWAALGSADNRAAPVVEIKY